LVLLKSAEVTLATNLPSAFIPRLAAMSWRISQVYWLPSAPWDRVERDGLLAVVTVLRVGAVRGPLAVAPVGN
jgi:hypothetical protein